MVRYADLTNHISKHRQNDLHRWYADRKEVQAWQIATTNRAKKEKNKYGRPIPFVSSLLGRARPLPDLISSDRRKQGHASRASINTPIQARAAQCLYIHQRVRNSHAGGEKPLPALIKDKELL